MVKDIADLTIDLMILTQQPNIKLPSENLRGNNRVSCYHLVFRLLGRPLRLTSLDVRMIVLKERTCQEEIIIVSIAINWLDRPHEDA